MLYVRWSTLGQLRQKDKVGHWTIKITIKNVTQIIIYSGSASTHENNEMITHAVKKMTVCVSPIVCGANRRLIATTKSAFKGDPSPSQEGHFNMFLCLERSY